MNPNTTLTFLKKITKKTIVALGGLSKDNYKLIKLIGLNGIAGISFFKSL